MEKKLLDKIKDKPANGYFFLAQNRDLISSNFQRCKNLKDGWIF